MVDIARLINQGLRYYNALVLAAKGFSFNKRFINLNIFVGFLIFIILIQSVFLKKARSFEALSDSLVVLKTDVYSSNYDNLFKHYDPQQFQKFSFNKRCNLFFDTLSLKDHTWKFDDFNTEGYDDNLYSFDAYVNSMKSENPNLDLDANKITELEQEYYAKNAVSKKVDTKIIDAISALRIFGKCFIDTERATKFTMSGFLSGGDPDTEASNSGKANQDLCLDTESRIFPWLSNILPTYTRWNGDVSVGIPDIAEGVEYKDYDGFTKEKRATRNKCFLSSLKKQINGRGYVVSASDNQVDELKKLALVLRANGNKLPIQIVHKGDLSEASRKALVEQFRRPIKEDALPSIALDLGPSFDLSFPPQEVWFVNVRQAVNPDFADHFHKYANKLLAYLFNSFEQMILVDTDTVPFVKLEEIFEYPEYLENGAYFFQDRNLEGQNTENQVNYFTRLFPSKLDHHFFEIPLLSKTLDFRFFAGRRNHFMESGVVAINRKKHFSGMLMAVQLNFWGPTSKKIHGDKELFWLGLSLVGDENYSFNKYGAASIGEVTPQSNKRLPESNAREICSNHPGHIDSHQEKMRLTWINSGFTYCKNTDAAAHDFVLPLYKGKSEAEVRNLYKGVTKIRAAIVPPPQEVRLPNEFTNPSSGWTDEHKYCWGYTWCAYDFIGDGSQDEERGTYIEFDDDQNKWFDFIGTIWMNDIPPSE